MTLPETLENRISDDMYKFEEQAIQISTRDRLNAILGLWRGHGGCSGHAGYKAIWNAHLEDMYLASQGNCKTCLK